DPAVADVIGYSGGGMGASNAWMMIRLKPRAERGETAMDVVNRLRVQVPPVAGGWMWLRVQQDIEMPRTSDSGSYDLMLLSSEVSLIREWGPKAARALQAVPELVDVDGPNDGGTMQVMLH